jgi:stalled ribosome rescue protein Dom34
LRGELPKELEGRVADTVFQAPNGQDCSLVLEQAVAAFIEAEEHESRGVVERLHQEICRGGLAVVGVDRVREVMRMGAASELVISENLAIVDREELVRLATSLDLAVEVCENDEVLDDHGGVGCLLRYRVDYPGSQVGDGEG